MALASGATFAGYLVARRLGSGETGAVYLVQDPRSSRWQALKVLSPAMSTDGEFRRRFRSETPIAAHLYHPNIVEVRDRGEFEGQLYVAMEYVEGSNAARLMADRFPAVSPAGEVLAIVTAIAGALDYAHERGLLHRDVKPANILLPGRGEGEQRILLTDFGIAGQPGTIGYAAPPRLSDQRPELARLDAVFFRALARSPADRFGTCRDFAEAASERAGISDGDRSPEAFLVAEYPAYVWPETIPEAHGTALRSAAAPLARRLDDFSPPPAADAREPAPRRRRPRKVVVGAAAVALVVGLLAVGFVIGRKTDTTAAQAARPTTSAAAAPGAPTASTPVA